MPLSSSASRAGAKERESSRISAHMTKMLNFNSENFDLQPSMARPVGQKIKLQVSSDLPIFFQIFKTTLA